MTAEIMQKTTIEASALLFVVFSFSTRAPNNLNRGYVAFSKYRGECFHHIR